MEHAQRIRDAFKYLTNDELKAIYDLSVGKSVLVNIGAGSGTSGLALREGAGGDAEIYTIDISSGGPLGGLTNERNAFWGTGLKMPHQVLSDSRNYGFLWENGEIDLLFIDGDHSIEGIVGDIDAWVKHVKSGGIILVHDYGSNDWPAVKDNVDRLASEYQYELIDIVDTLAIARKQ